MNPLDALRHLLALGVTGVVEVHPASGPSVSVYLMQGEIVAAESPDDASAILGLLVRSGQVTASVARRLQGRRSGTAPLGSLLIGRVPDDVVVTMFAERFRENLGRFLLSGSFGEFLPLDVVTVENVQAGHDSHALLVELQAVLDQVAPLRQRPDLVVRAGPQATQDPECQALLEALGQERDLAGLVSESPFEPLRTLELVHGLLERGILETDVDWREVPGPSGLESGAPGSDQEPVVADDASVAGHDEEAGMAGGGDLREVMAWEPAIVEENVLHEELERFGDQEQHPARRGEYVVAAQYLDFVDLGGGGALPDIGGGADEMVLEMEELDDASAAGFVTLTFGSPPLTQAESRLKVEVVNEVLRTMTEALDAHHAPGGGKAVVLVLLETAPPEQAWLFHGVEPARDGELPADAILRNLSHRPEAERRRLLNTALQDLIERVLMACVEVLPEDGLEEMLRAIAGFQKRLGR